jgi:hypothetical protein
MGEGMTTPFWSKAIAVREANCLANAIRCHGACAEVIVADEDLNELSRTSVGASLVRQRTGRQNRWPDAR